MSFYDASAIGSDKPRSFGQFISRRFAQGLVKLLGLNRGGFFSTEIVQQIKPVCTIATKYGPIRCRAGHGRLRWRAETFYTEEPQTIIWLESIAEDDYLWDIGANVGLYSIYAAKARGCPVLAIEPEPQNLALLIENVVMNKMQAYIEVANLAVSSKLGLGKLYLHDITKGGAYNHFFLNQPRDQFRFKTMESAPLAQVQMGLSLDDLVKRFNYRVPTHIKIDVDGNEPDIIAGMEAVLSADRLKSILIEIHPDDTQTPAVLEKLKSHGFSCASERSNWESRLERSREKEHSAVNMIFRRPQ